MKIDMFTHILPDRYFKRFLEKAPPKFFMEKRFKGLHMLSDLERRFRVMDDFEDYAQVLTLASPIEDSVAPEDAVDLARLANDEMAEIVAKYPDRFVGAVACLPMNNREAAMNELDRAMDQLKMKGVQIFTSVNGRPLDSPEFSFVFERMGDYDIPLWIHPLRRESSADYPAEDRSKYQVWSCFGWPFETTAAMTRIVFTGMFDRYPDLKIITHHLGGMVPYFCERIRSSFDSFGTRSEDDVGSMRKLKKHPYDYFRMFYGDTAVNGFIPALECGFAFFGSERIVFGTDMPFGSEKGEKMRKTIQSVEGMTASIEDKNRIFELNARRLLKMPPLE